MKVTLLCSSPAHPINVHLERWMARHSRDHEVRLVRRASDLAGGDLLFLVSCTEIVRADQRAKFRSALVLHASDLPHGRGWSPHIWAIVQGETGLTVTLLEASDKVDSGRIWKKAVVAVPRHALWDEINELLFQTELDLMNSAIEHFNDVAPVDQPSSIEPTYYRQRTPEDSKIDPERSLAEQFNLLRVCDPNRFPAYFELHGHRYKLTLEKIDGPVHNH